MVCYTSQTANNVSAILNLLGYNARAMRYDMISWVKGEINEDPKKNLNAQKIWSSSVSQVIFGADYALEVSQ